VYVALIHNVCFGTVGGGVGLDVGFPGLNAVWNCSEDGESRINGKVCISPTDHTPLQLGPILTTVTIVYIVLYENGYDDS
jgi:hypothetical protein